MKHIIKLTAFAISLTVLASVLHLLFGAFLSPLAIASALFTALVALALSTHSETLKTLLRDCYFRVNRDAYLKHVSKEIIGKTKR